MSTPTLRRRSSESAPDDPSAPRDPGSRPDPAEPMRAYGGDPPADLGKGVAEASPDGLKYIFEIAKSEVDFQFRIAERLDSKARGLFALAGAIFAAAQALALREDVLDRLSDADRHTVVTIAIVAGSILGAALLATAIAIFVKPEKNVASDKLFEWLTTLRDKKSSDLDVSRDAVSMYISLMHYRQHGNKWRVRALWVVQILCVAAIAASAYELIVALDGLA